MHVLHVIHSLDPRSGGPSHAIRQMVNAQIQFGMTAEIVASSVQSAEPWQSETDYRSTLDNDPDLANIPFTVLSSRGRRRPWSRYAWTPDAGKWMRKRLLASDGPDFVHVHGLFSHITETAAAICRECHTPYAVRPAGVLDAGCMKRGQTFLKNAFVRMFAQKSLRQSAFVHATSDKEKDAIQTLLPGTPVVVVPHATEPPDQTGGRFREQINGLGDREFILCLSRIHPIKRLDLAIDAFAKISGRSDVDLVIAGNDADGLDTLKQQATRLGLNRRIHFPGFVQGADKAKAYSEARIFLHPSEHENFGLSVVEAMAGGTPVITTKGVAACEYVRVADAGLVVDGAVDNIANAISELLEMDKSGPGRRGKEFVKENLTWPVTTERLHALYEDAIRNRPPANAAFA
jgi:glycosyltransferase involved in cell wall biosynthesis